MLFIFVRFCEKVLFAVQFFKLGAFDFTLPLQFFVVSMFVFSAMVDHWIAFSLFSAAFTSLLIIYMEIEGAFYESAPSKSLFTVNKIKEYSIPEFIHNPKWLVDFSISQRFARNEMVEFFGKSGKLQEIYWNLMLRHSLIEKMIAEQF